MSARWPLAALAALVAAWPWLASRYLVFLASLILVNAVVAIGLNLLSGYTNQLSFGHAGFLAIGAYTAALLSIHAPALPVVVALAAAGLLTAAVGLAFGVPCLRLHGLYLAMATLAFGVVIAEAILNLDTLTRGADGLRVPVARLGPWVLAGDAARYYLVAGVAAIMTAAAVNLVRTRTGRAFLAIRESEIAAEASGVPVARYKLYALLLSAAFTSLAGSLYSLMVGFIDPESGFGILRSVEMIIIAALGGAGTLFGPLLGAVILIPLQTTTNSLFGGGGSGLTYILYGGIIVILARFEPGGLLDLARRIAQWWSRRREGVAVRHAA